MAVGGGGDDAPRNGPTEETWTLQSVWRRGARWGTHSGARAWKRIGRPT